MQTLLKRSLVCFAALLVSWQASAQTSMTRAQLEANINSKVTTNGHGELTGAILNSVLQNMAASTTTLLDTVQPSAPPMTAFPGLTASVNGGGPGLSFAGCSTLATCSWNLYAAPTTAAEAAFTPLLITRDATGYSAGTSGDTIDSLQLFTKTAPGGNYYDWTLLSNVLNETASTTNAQNVAIQATITKTFPSGDSTERSASWAINGVCTDNFVNPTTGCTGMELDVNGDSTDSSHNRSGLTIVAGGTNTPHIGAAMQISATSGATIDNLGLLFGDFTNGFEFGGATFANPPIQLGAGQQIAFDAPGDGTFNRTLYYNSGSLAYKVVSSVVFGLADSGQPTFMGTTAPPSAGSASDCIKVSSTANFGLCWGSGAPTFTAAQGTLYLRTDGSSTSTRLYVNTSGSTTWTNFSSAS